MNDAGPHAAEPTGREARRPARARVLSRVARVAHVRWRLHRNPAVAAGLDEALALALALAQKTNRPRDVARGVAQTAKGAEAPPVPARPGPVTALVQARSAVSTSSSIFFASPNNMRLFSL